METFSASLALCAGNSPVTGEFPAKWPVTRNFDVFFDLHLKKRLSKQSRRWWFDTPSRSLWRHCDDIRHVGQQQDTQSTFDINWIPGSPSVVWYPVTLLCIVSFCWYSCYTVLLSIRLFNKCLNIYDFPSQLCGLATSILPNVLIFSSVGTR